MGGRNGDEIIGYKNLNHLMGLIEPYTYQVSKEEVLDLPAKTETAKYCYLTDEQEEYYYAEKDRLLEIIQRDEVRATDIFEVFTHMQQITSGYYKNRDGEVKILGSNKPAVLSNMELNEPTVFFCKYLFEIDTIVAHLGRENCAIFSGQNPKERDSELQLFREGKRRYFVATMQSGGTGLNGLQEVSCQAIFYSNSFSYFQRKQSIGRIDRPGQTKPTTIIDILTRSGIDTRIMNNLSRKGNLADEIKEMMKDKTKLKQYVEGL
jgi:SNF2 family DNA or RNA helicase